MIILSRIKGIHITDSGYRLDTFIQNILLVHTWVPKFSLNWNYPSWSISSEWFIYLWFPVISSLILNKLKSITLISILLSLTWIASIAIYATGEIPFKELLVVVPTFLTGTFLYKLWANVSHNYSPSILTPDLCLLLVIFLPFFCGGTLLISLYISLFIAIILSLALLQDSCSKYWKIPPVINLGKVSYSLYMSHTLAQKLCYGLIPVQSFSTSNLFTKIFILGLYLGTIAMFCTLTYFLIEKPSRTYLRSILKS
jgi:peptidoglycan/LPS O-acetylase OafA/YrhL